MKIMKKISYMIVGAVILFMSATSVFAQQNFRTGYFLDGYTHKYKFNPAFQGERGHIGIPVISDLGLGVESNVALDNFLFPTGNGNLTTFLSPKVDGATFLNALKDDMTFNTDFSTSILSLGLRTGRGFHTIDFGARLNMGVYLPKDLFRLVKVGASDGNTAYDISNIAFKANMMTELSYGYSHCIFDGLTVGARVKFLLGAANLNIAMDNMNVKMAADEWSVKSKGTASLAGPLTIPAKADGSLDLGGYDFLDTPDELIQYYLKDKTNFGIAFDFGVTADFLDYFTASASVLDIGSIKWGKVMTAQTPETAWSFKGFEDLTDKSDDSSVGKQLEGMGDELMKAFNFKKTADDAEISTKLGMTVNVSFEARMPFYEALSFGVLGTRRFDGDFSWTEGRVAASLSPFRWLSATANYAVSDFGHSFGGAVNLHTGLFTLYAGTDSLLPFMNVSSEYIPISSWNTNVIVGLNLTLGAYKGRH